MEVIVVPTSSDAVDRNRLHAILDVASARVQIILDYPHRLIARRGGAGQIKSYITRGIHAQLYGTVTITANENNTGISP